MMNNKKKTGQPYMTSMDEQKRYKAQPNSVGQIQKALRAQGTMGWHGSGPGLGVKGGAPNQGGSTPLQRKRIPSANTQPPQLNTVQQGMVNQSQKMLPPAKGTGMATQGSGLSAAGGGVVGPPGRQINQARATGGAINQDQMIDSQRAQVLPPPNRVTSGREESTRGREYGTANGWTTNSAPLQAAPMQTQGQPANQGQGVLEQSEASKAETYIDDTTPTLAHPDGNDKFGQTKRAATPENPSSPATGAPVDQGSGQQSGTPGETPIDGLDTYVQKATGDSNAWQNPDGSWQYTGPEGGSIFIPEHKITEAMAARDSDIEARRQQRSANSLDKAQKEQEAAVRSQSARDRSSAMRLMMERGSYAGANPDQMLAGVGDITSSYDNAANSQVASQNLAIQLKNVESELAIAMANKDFERARVLGAQQAKMQAEAIKLQARLAGKISGGDVFGGLLGLGETAAGVILGS